MNVIYACSDLEAKECMLSTCSTEEALAIDANKLRPRAPLPKYQRQGEDDYSDSSGGIYTDYNAPVSKLSADQRCLYFTYVNYAAEHLQGLQFL